MTNKKFKILVNHGKLGEELMEPRQSKQGLPSYTDNTLSLNLSGEYGGV